MATLNHLPFSMTTLCVFKCARTLIKTTNTICRQRLSKSKHTHEDVSLVKAKGSAGVLQCNESVSTRYTIHEVMKLLRSVSLVAD